MGHGWEASTTNQSGQWIRLLRVYRDFISSPPDLSQARSKALKEVESYLAAVRTSDEFTGLCGFLDTVGSLGGVVFRVSLDNDGLPAKMTAWSWCRGTARQVGILAFFERILGGGSSRRACGLRQGSMRPGGSSGDSLTGSSCLSSGRMSIRYGSHLSSGTAGILRRVRRVLR